VNNKAETQKCSDSRNYEPELFVSFRVS